jgi:hypothetical protein
MGDIGGFNASSALTWQALGIIGYDHNRDGFKYNMDMHGPVFGLEAEF